MIDEMGGGLCHVPTVARRADASSSTWPGTGRSAWSRHSSQLARFSEMTVSSRGDDARSGGVEQGRYEAGGGAARETRRGQRPWAERRVDGERDRPYTTRGMQPPASSPRHGAPQKATGFGWSGTAREVPDTWPRRSTTTAAWARR